MIQKSYTHQPQYSSYGYCTQHGGTTLDKQLISLFWETFKDWFLNEVSISVMCFALLTIALWSYLT